VSRKTTNQNQKVKTAIFLSQVPRKRNGFIVWYTITPYSK